MTKIFSYLFWVSPLDTLSQIHSSLSCTAYWQNHGSTAPEQEETAKEGSHIYFGIILVIPFPGSFSISLPMHWHREPSTRQNCCLFNRDFQGHCI